MQEHAWMAGSADSECGSRTQVNFGDCVLWLMHNPKILARWPPLPPEQGAGGTNSLSSHTSSASGQPGNETCNFRLLPTMEQASDLFGSKDATAMTPSLVWTERTSLTPG